MLRGTRLAAAAAPLCRTRATALPRRRSRAAAGAVGAGAVGAGAVGVVVGLTATAAAAAAEEEDPDSDNLQLWLRQRGARLSGVSFRRCADPAKGRGAFLVSGGRAQDVLVHLPRSLVLTAERVMVDVPALRTLRKQTETLGTPLAAALGPAAANDALLLTVFILHSRLSDGAGEGEWADYIAALPFEFDTPAGWPAESAAIACIEATPLEGAVRAKRSWLAQVCEALPTSLRQAGLSELADALEAEPDRGMAALGWADAVVWSRGVGVPRGETETTLSLMPGIDMCNHTEDPTAGWMPAPAGGLELIRRRAGETVAVFIKMDEICSKSNEFCIENDEFVLKSMNSVYTLMIIMQRPGRQGAGADDQLRRQARRGVFIPLPRIQSFNVKSAAAGPTIRWVTPQIAESPLRSAQTIMNDESRRQARRGVFVPLRLLSGGQSK